MITPSRIVARPEYKTSEIAFQDRQHCGHLATPVDLNQLPDSFESRSSYWRRRFTRMNSFNTMDRDQHPF